MENKFVQDPDTSTALAILEKRGELEKYRIVEVKSILVVLPASSMAFDPEALKQKLSLAYPGAAIFMESPSGASWIGRTVSSVDLLIDLTGPGTREAFFRPRKLRRRARVVVGRNAGWFGQRKRLYDRIFDEKLEIKNLPCERFLRERWVQKRVLALAGVAMVPVGELTQDRANDIALELPPLRHA